MNVKQIVLDPRNQAPIVILQSADETHALPIWIGPYEASAIIMAIEDVKFPRPLTHDLLLNVIREFGGALEAVLIHQVQDATFYAELKVSTPDGVRKIDARPSDAIALALRVPCPVMAKRSILETAEQMEKFLTEAQAEQYKNFLENLDPKEISKYKM